MLNKIALVVLLSFVTFLTQADTVTINPDHPDQYVVKKGDTLWDISGMFLSQPWRWPEVWKGNPQIEDPHLIYPGDVIRLSYVDGKPFLTASGPGMVVSGRNVKLSPVVREHEKDEAIPTIPIDVIKHFLARPIVVDGKDIDGWPYVIGSQNDHLVASSGIKVYVRGMEDGYNEGRYSIYRKGNAYVSNRGEESEVLGYEALYIGDAEISKMGDPATGIISSAKREILKGDRLVRESEGEIDTDFIPRSPSGEMNGNILSVVDGVSEIGQYQVVVIDIGMRDGIEKGNVLGIYQSGEEIVDKFGPAFKEENEYTERIVLPDEDKSAFNRELSGIVNAARDLKHWFWDDNLGHYMGKRKSKGEVVTLPEEYAGVLMIIRTFEKLSYGLVMEVQAPVHIDDAIRNL